MTSFIDAIKNAEYQEKLKRIAYLKSEIAAGARHDGWVLEGLKKELKKLKKLWKNTFTEEN